MVLLCACGGPSAHVEPEGASCAGAISSAPVHIEAGSFIAGQNAIYPEETPEQRLSVAAFWIDPHEVTVGQFAEFVAATSHVTTAEKPVDPSVFGDVPADDIPPELLKPGSAVFVQPSAASRNPASWWRYVAGASWRAPFGPDGPTADPDEPAVHLTLEDMEAYADWAGGRLPTEAEWEYAALGRQPATTGQPAEANSWQGIFPVINETSDGFAGVAPAGCFAPNGYGLYDMLGNVWEMTSEPYTPRRGQAAAAPTIRSGNLSLRVMKGGSFLCAPNYCQRYRPQARTYRDPGLGASNVGFRLVYDEKPGGEPR